MTAKTKHKECATAVELCHQDMVSQRLTSSEKWDIVIIRRKMTRTVELLGYFTMQVAFKNFL